MGNSRVTRSASGTIDLIVPLLCLALHACAVALVAAYHAPPRAIGFTEPLTFPLLASAISKIDAQSLRSAVAGLPHAALMPVAIAAAVPILRRTRLERRSSLRIAFLAFQPVAFYPGFLGLLILPFLFFGEPLDGEFLAEDFPILVSMGVWIAGSIFLLAAGLRRRGEDSPVARRPA